MGTPSASRAGRIISTTFKWAARLAGVRAWADPESGSTAYAYDTLNRLSTLTPPSAFTTGNFGFSYDALSRRTQMTRPNSVTTNYAYDNLSRLTSVLHQLSGSTIDGATYTLDNAGNRTAKTDQRTAVATSYGYDNVYQLLSATPSSGPAESYTYDPVGNRLSSAGVPSYSYNSSNQLTATSSASYGFDYNGNTTSKTDSTGTTNYTWDFENRLTSVTLPGSGGTVSFKYDPFGRRIYKSSSSGTSIYAYDSDNLVEETNASGAVVARYSQDLAIDAPLAMLRNSATSYYEQDGIGTVTSLSNTAGALAQTYTFDSFGNQTASSGSLSNPFRFTGREFDSESGLYYMRARYFDSATGRFINEDPIAFYGGTNFYRYARSNPVNWADPSGLVEVVPLPDANIHRLADIDPDCGHPTAGGCERVGYTADWSCKKDCDTWSAKVKITLGGPIYVATGPFPYKGRKPQDPSVHDTASALAHEMLHVNDKLNAILPIYRDFESKTFKSKEECEKTGLAADLQASSRWTQAGQDSQRRRH
jgi:RHS repeat-associated protein